MALRLERLVRPNILRLEPYRSAREECNTGGILLDANENPFGPCVQTEEEFHRYPDPKLLELLKQKIAEFRCVKKEQVFLGTGCDGAIDTAIKVFCTPGKDSILVTPPTYSMFKILANSHDVNVISVPLTEKFQLQVEKILDAVTPRTKIIFLCSPNNPTANNMDTDDILAILNSSYDGIVAVDEAYVDFSKTPSFCNYLNDYPQLIVFQTMSKAFGLATLRLGMAIAHEDIIAIFDKVKLSNGINTPALKIGYEAFSNIEVMKENVHKILKEKKKLIAELEKLSFVKKIFPSDSNFLLVRVEHAYDIYRAMAARGVVTRYRGNELHCDNCIRVTVSTPEENSIFIKMMKKTFQETENKKNIQNDNA